MINITKRTNKVNNGNKKVTEREFKQEFDSGSG